MALIDERGRVFGLVNLIDAGVAVLVAAIVAAAAVGYAVFKVPALAEISKVEPASQPVGEGLRVVIRGKNFLPFMTVRVQRTGDSEKAVRRANPNPRANVDRYALVTSTVARFFVESPTVAEVWLPDNIEPGSYDLVMHNETQLVALKEAAFTITPAPAPAAPPVLPLGTVRLFGTFTSVKRADVSGISVGAKLVSTVAGESAEVLSVGTAEPDIVNPLAPAQINGAVKVPATLRIQCSFTGSDCRIDKTVLARTNAITLRDRDRVYAFTISDVVADGAPHATVRAAGVFTRLDGPDLTRLVAGAKFTSGVSGESGEVLSVGTAEPNVERLGSGESVVPAAVPGRMQVAATLRIRCVLTGTDCRVWSTPLTRNALIKLTIGGRPYAFAVAELAADLSDNKRDARVAVRLVLRPEIAALVKAGDVDIRVPTIPNTLPAIPSVFPVPQARLISVGTHRDSTSLTQVSVGEAIQQLLNVQEPVVLTDAVLSVPVTESPGGWLYKGQPVKAGLTMSFETARYFARGLVLSVSVDGEPAATAPTSK